MQTATRKIDSMNPGEELTHHSDILEACLQALESEGATIESCVKQYPDFAELGNLLSVAQAVQRVQQVSLSQVSKKDVRERMLAHYRGQQTAPRQAQWSRPLKTVSALVLFVTVMIDLTILIGVTLVADRVLFANQPGLE